MIDHQLIVVGAGLAGLRAAIEAKDAGVDVGMLTQVHPGRSHSGAAQGGVNAALANHPDAQDDNPEKHAFDTVKGSDYLADQHAALQMTTDAVPAIYELEHMGCPFSRFDDGRIAQRPFGGAGYPRTCYGADKTGHYMLHALVEQAYKRQVKTYIEWFVCRLIVEDGVCKGVVAYNMVRGGFEEFRGEAVIMATGGAGRTYSNTSNAVISTGGGAAMAYHAGVPLKDMEFVQFHPTTLYTTHILMTEGCRGEGGYLLNKDGERFMARYAPTAMELAPRDITSRSIQTEINEGRGIDGKDFVYLDLRHLGAEKLAERLPGTRDLSIHFEGVDPVYEPDPDPAGPALLHGRHRHRRRRPHGHARLARRRRVRLRQRARRQPPRRQLLARDGRLRRAAPAPPRRATSSVTSAAPGRARATAAPPPPCRPRWTSWPGARAVRTPTSCARR